MEQITLKMRRRTPPQRRISQSNTRFNLGIWGRQSGKTTYGLDKCVFAPLTGRPEGIYWYILQTLSAAEVAFNRYWRLFKYEKRLLAKKPNETEKKVVLANGASVFFKSGDNFEDLRIETLDGCVIDEYRQQHPELLSRVVMPMLSKRKGWLDILSTTNGFDHTYDLYEKAEADPLNWSVFHAPSTEAPWWTPQEIALQRSIMSEEEFAQEIMCEFREFGRGKVYLTHGKHNHRDTNPFVHNGEKWSPYLPITVGLDFNVGLMCWTLGQCKGRESYWGEEVALTNTNTEMQSKVLVDRVRGHVPGVVLVGDASGKSQKTSASGQTDYSIIVNALKGAGIPVSNKTPEANPHIKDRVNAMNAALRSADGVVSLWYNPNTCTYLKKDLERVVWKEGAQGALFDKTKDLTLTHSSDSVGYPVTLFSKQWRPSPGVPIVIRR